MRESILDDARIYDTKLNNADFTHTSCKPISVLDAEAIGTDFSHSQMDRAKPNRSHCEYAKFDSARLRHVYMSSETGQDAETVHLEGAYFRKANLEGASLTGVVLSGSYLMGANLKGASFVAVQFVGATPSAKQIELISQWRPQEVTADLHRGANLSGTRLNTHTRMTASVFTQQGNIGAYFDHIRWNGVQLADANW